MFIEQDGVCLLLLLSIVAANNPCSRHVHNRCNRFHNEPPVVLVCCKLYGIQRKIIISWKILAWSTTITISSLWKHKLHIVARYCFLIFDYCLWNTSFGGLVAAKRGDRDKDERERKRERHTRTSQYYDVQIL